MGSDSENKINETTVSVEGVRIPRWGAKFVVSALVFLMSSALILKTLMKGVPITPSLQVSAPGKSVTKAPAQQKPAPPLLRPPSESSEYDQYFAQQALSFTLGSDFDVSSKLRKQGFRGTRKWVIDVQKDALRRSALETLLRNHTEWMYADWRSLKAPFTLPVLFRGTTNSKADMPISLKDRNKIEMLLDFMRDHAFWFEMARTTSLPLPLFRESEKTIFAYTNHTWHADRLSSERFISLLELFTSRKLHGAHMKEFLHYQTPTYSLMSGLDSFEMANQSMLMTSLVPPPRAIVKACNITESLTLPIELKVLVVWGKAYMGTCFNAVCNPFVERRWRDVDGPRYTVYPDGQSNFRNSETFTPAMHSCTNAVNAFVQPKLNGTSGVMAAAERIAAGLGAPWLRVDFFLTDMVQEGILLHRVRTISSSVAGWTQRSERVMQIIARGFEKRGQHSSGKVPPTVSTTTHLAKLGCQVGDSGIPQCMKHKPRAPLLKK